MRNSRPTSIPLILTAALMLACAPPQSAPAGPEPTATGRAGTTAPTAHTFEEASCLFDPHEAVAAGVRCGWIAVPEAWGGDESRQIRIPVAVFRAAAAERRPDPVIFVMGGPGPFLARLSNADLPPRNRDWVFFDYRGTGFGEQICPDIGVELWRAGSKAASSSDRRHDRTRLARECDAWAGERGIDLGNYTPEAMARDVVAIALALGYSEWNVLAGAFGTRVAQEVVRIRPEGLRALVLEGAAPVDAAWYLEGNFLPALEGLWRHCSEESRCSAAFPDPRAEYEALLQRLENATLQVPVGNLDVHPRGSALVDVEVATVIIRELLDAPATAGTIPLLVRQTAERTPALLSAVLERITPASLPNGAYWAAQCYDDTAGPLPDPREAPFAASHRAVCEGLGIRKPSAEQAPFSNDVPVLIFAPELDPVRSAANARAVAGQLPQGHYVVLPSRTRGQLLFDPCIIGIAGAFLEDPRTRPKDGCAAEHRPIPFMTGAEAGRR